MQASLLIPCLTLAIGLLIGVTLEGDPEASVKIEPGPAVAAGVMFEQRVLASASDDSGRGDDIIELNRLLQQEIGARRNLEQKIELLSRRLASFGEKIDAIGQVAVDEQSAEASAAELASADDGRFNEQALIAAGMEIGQAVQLKRHFEQLEMERLYLRDQSVRENWDRAKFREAMQALAAKEDDLQNQLSESAYDAYLYAAGRPNRVEVSSLIDSAQAGIAGIRAGDHIVKYDGQRVYNGFELRDATSGGIAGDTVALEVERDGKNLHFYVPRGPLGIRMNSINVSPLP